MARLLTAVSLISALLLHPARALAQVADEEPIAAPQPTVPELIDAAAWKYGLSATRLRRIARCESGMGSNPLAYRWDRAHRGVFQFSRRTFEWAAPRAGYPANWALAFDDAINVDVAAWLMSHPRQGGGFQHWTCK